MILAPIRGKYRITQGYGVNPETYGAMGRKLGIPLQSHNGQDLAVPVGTQIYAPIDGKVSIGYDFEGYGKFVRIKGFPENSHGDYREIILAHLSEWNVKQGQTVRAGTWVGLSGDTGFSTGPHLHWGLRRRTKDGKIIGYNDNLGYEDIFKKGWISKNEPSKY